MKSSSVVYVLGLGVGISEYLHIITDNAFRGLELRLYSEILVTLLKGQTHCLFKVIVKWRMRL